MRLIELTNDYSLEIRLEAALKAFDWEYDIDATDNVRLDKGIVAHNELQIMMGALYTREPVLARIMWEAYCPYAQPGSLPAILRR